MEETNDGPLSRLEHARLRIAHLRLDQSEDLWRAMQSAARVSASSLEVTRVGVWFLSADRLELHRVVVHDDSALAAAQAGDPPTLPLHEWPAYLDAILSRRAVAADDAPNDPRTRELGPTYLARYGITSMLDAPLFLGGEVWGIVCHEHTGPARSWHAREIDFAVSVADMLSALLEQSKRLGFEKRRRQEDAAVARARHAEVLARTAAGIGHDVNTVLQAITATADRALQASDPAAREKALAGILADCQRGARIVEQLRDLERPRAALQGALDLAIVIADLEPTLTALLGPDHELESKLTPEAFVVASRTDIERVVLNLVVNARDATPNGGTIRVSVTASGDVVTLSVHDDGLGIPAGEVEQIFEPYFTTKPARNTGLGLYAVRTIAARTEGQVSARSSAGAGTTMTVTWPLASDG